MGNDDDDRTSNYIFMHDIYLYSKLLPASKIKSINTKKSSCMQKIIQ